MERGEMQRPYEILHSLREKQKQGGHALYFTTIEITLELWEKMISTQRLPLPGFTNSLLLKQLRVDIPAHENDDRLQDWEVDCEFFPCDAEYSLRINNGGEINGEKWGLCLDRSTLCALRKTSALLCGIDLTIWVYIDDDTGLHSLAVSKFWSSDRLEVLLARLAPSPATSSDDQAGFGEGSHAA